MLALSIATLAIFAVPQTSSTPTLSPDGEPLEFLDVESVGGRTLIAARVFRVFGPGSPLIYELDSSGQLQLLDGVRPDGVLAQHSPVAISADRILMASGFGDVLVLERGPNGWRRSGAVLPSMGQITVNVERLEISGHTGAYIDSTGTLLVPDLTDPSQVTIEMPVVVPQGSTLTEFELDGDTLVTSTTVGATGTLTNSTIRVYERTAGVWDGGVDLQLPANSGMDESWTEMTLDGDTLAVVGKGLDGVDDCRVIYVFDRSPGGAFALTEILRPSRNCSRIGAYGAEVTSPSLSGDLLVLYRAFDHSCERFRRSAAGWTEIDPRRSISSTRSNGYRAAGPFTLASGGDGLEVFDDSAHPAEGVEFLCDSAVVATDSSLLIPKSRTSLAFGPRTLDWFTFGTEGGAVPGLVLVGLQPDSILVGPESNLCIRVARRLPVTLFRLPDIGSVIRHRTSLVADPGTFGVSPGTKVYYQCWSPQPGVSGGRTSNAVTVAF